MCCFSRCALTKFRFFLRHLSLGRQYRRPLEEALHQHDILLLQFIYADFVMPLAPSAAIRIDDRVQYDINVVSSCGYRQFTLLIIRIFLLHRARADFPGHRSQLRSLRLANPLADCFGPDSSSY